MQRKRSYVEAMDAGSVYDLLEPTGVLASAACNPDAKINQSETKSEHSEKDINVDTGLENSDQNTHTIPENPSDSNTPTDGASDDLNSETVRIQIHADENGDKMNEINNSNKDLRIHIAIDETGTAISRRIAKPSITESVCTPEELIDDVYNNCFEYISNEEISQRHNSFIPSDLDGVNILKFNSNERSENGPNANGEGGLDRQFSTDYSREDLSDDLISRDNEYDSDDVLEYEGETEIGRSQRQNSLIIPNNAVSDGSSILPILYTGRNSARKSKKTQEKSGFRARRSKRVVFKNGETNIPVRQHISGMLGKYMKDIVTTLIEIRWRWLTLLFGLVHFILWLLFALMFYLASYANGDLSDTPGSVLCIENGKTFTGIFTFSVETQVSIGYGEKSPTEECPETIFIMLMEVVTGYILLGGMVGIVYAKIVRPKKKLEGVGFSKRAVVCMRDGKLCLVLRVWDAREKHAVGTHAAGWLVRHGGPSSVRLALTPSAPLVLWPTTLEHVMDESSPLYDVSAKDLIDQRFEVVITLTGSSRQTGQMSQSRTSYLPQDILWGQRFKNVLSYDIRRGSYVVDIKSLNKMSPVDTPLCSARLLQQVAEQGPSSPFFRSTPSSPPSTLTSPGWSFRRKYKPLIAKAAG